MGGDEFCALIPASETLLHRAASSLFEEGESFVVSSAFGAVTLPDEAANPSAALSLADQRLYAQRTGCLPRARARTSCCCGRWPSVNRACAPTSRVWPGWPSPSAANWA